MYVCTCYVYVWSSSCCSWPGQMSREYVNVMYVCTFYVNVCVYVNVMCICKCYVHVCMYTNACMYTNIYTYTHTCIHAYIYTHTHMQLASASSDKSVHIWHTNTHTHITYRNTHIHTQLRPPLQLTSLFVYGIQTHIHTSHT
jgi:hypothetical protein